MTGEPKATKIILLLALLNIFLAGVLSYQTLAYNFKTQTGIAVRQTEILDELETTKLKLKMVMTRQSVIMTNLELILKK